MLIVVSGCPRSGTSLMMDIMRSALGDGRVIGGKFPNDDSHSHILNQQKEESDKQWRIRQYIQDKVGITQRVQKEIEQTRKLNPNGFYECAYTVQGLRYDPLSNFQKDLLESTDTKVMKIVSQGLAKTDPRFVSKIVFMLRHPYAVAKSQENLKGQFGPTDNPRVDGQEIKINSARMFLQVGVMAACWFNRTGFDPLLVEFDDLIELPQRELGLIQEYLGEGDFVEAASRIDPKLRRSYQEAPDDNPQWARAVAIWEMMRVKDWPGVVEYAKDVGKRSREKRKSEAQTSRFCPRLMRRVVDNECELCYLEPNTRKNFIKTATEHKIDWENEPCIYECEREEISIEESIARNHWRQMDCAHGTLTTEPALPGRPCYGRKVLCACDSVPFEFVPEKDCGKGKCNFYEED